LVVATGDRGSFVADTLLADLTFYENADVPMSWDGISSFRGVSEGNVTRYAIAKPEPLRVQLEGFRDRVLRGEGDVVTMREGMAAVAAADAALRSARTGTTVDVDETGE
jgi:Predicted dehydrogenases and related proteins